ncbi:MAG: hypothetical protein ACUVTX_04150 [Bacteroidales bacterium]
MENLIIEHKGRSKTNIIIGCVLILITISFLIFEKNPPPKADWNKLILFFIIGMISIIQPFLGLNRSKIHISDGYLIIRLIGWICITKIKESEIERIILAKEGIKIFRTGKKPVSIYLSTMKKEHKEQVYKFFTEYAHQRNFTSEE